MAQEQIAAQKGGGLGLLLLHAALELKFSIRVQQALMTFNASNKIFIWARSIKKKRLLHYWMHQMPSQHFKHVLNMQHGKTKTV